MNLFHKTALLSIAATLLAAPAAQAGHPHGKLYWLAGEIRGQAAEVDARLQSLLPYCHNAGDVQRELVRLCHDLDKFERRLAQGIYHPHDLKKLAWLADEIDDHADELWDELEDVLEDLDDHRHDFHKHRRAKKGSIPFGYYESGFNDPFVAQPKRASFRLTIGKHGPRFSVVSNRGVGSPLPYYPVAAPGTVLTDPSVVQGVPWGEVRGLKASVKRLHYLTQRLERMLDD